VNPSVRLIGAVLLFENRQEESKMLNIKRFIGFAAIMAAAAFILPLTANAQGLRYQNKYSKQQVSDIIRRMETSSANFRRDFDKALDASRLNGTKVEDQFNQNVKDFDRTVTTLRRNFDRNRNWWDTRNDVQSTINASQPVNNMINRLPFQRSVERQWQQLRNDLNTLADTFDMPGIAGGGWNGGGNTGWNGGNGGWNGSGQMSAPPTWAQGTFYGRGPNGEQIMLTIDGSGRATSNVNGGNNYGTYNRGLLYFNGNSARVSQWNSGIRTVSTMNGETINYSRNSWNNGGGIWNPGGSGSWDGSVGRPSSWAIGNFSAANPMDGSPIYMRVENNGRVTVTVGNQMSYGTMNGSSLRMGPYTSKVVRQGNGFRTVSSTDGQTIVYTRN